MAGLPRGLLADNCRGREHDTMNKLTLPPSSTALVESDAYVRVQQVHYALLGGVVLLRPRTGSRITRKTDDCQALRSLCVGVWMCDLPTQPFGMRRAVSTLCGPTRRQVRLAKRNTRCANLNAQGGAASGLYVMIAKRRQGKAWAYRVYRVCTCGLLLA